VRLPSFRSFLVVLSLTLMAGTSAADPRQSQAAFEAAIRDRSTSPYIVLITVVDDRTGQTGTGCSGANLLLGAIYIEGGDVSAAQLRPRSAPALRKLKGLHWRTPVTSSIFPVSRMALWCRG